MRTSASGSAWSSARTSVGGFKALEKCEGSDSLPTTVYRPHDFTAARTWPTLLFLHGMGESGADNKTQLTVGLAPELRAHPERWPFVVLFPQKPHVLDEWEDHEAQLIALLESAVRDHAADPRRIAITGISQGGHGAWEIARRHPERFVAVAPICGYPAAPARGWGNFERKRDWTIEMARASAATLAQTLRAKPVWTAHGDKDPIVPVEFTDAVVEALRERGTTPHYRRFNGVSHDAWVRAYGEPALSNWLRDKFGE
ncbi:MAG: alpha/beta hydrolase-fold protein [Planctomycetota bacterium]|nr:alpha/beta hydrolase-fold protein [Planctomycetota bacterium]